MCLQYLHILSVSFGKVMPNHPDKIIGLSRVLQILYIVHTSLAM